MKKKIRYLIINGLLILVALLCFFNIHGLNDGYSVSLNNEELIANGNCKIEEGRIALDDDQCTFLSTVLDDGKYNVNMVYKSEGNLSVNLFSSKYVDEKNVAGKSFAYANLVDSIISQEFEVSLDKRISDFDFYLTGSGVIEIKDISISYIGKYYNDNSICILLFVVFLILLAVMNVNRQFREMLYARNNFYIIVLLISIFVIVSLPVLGNNSLHNPDFQDLEYHLNRIQGLTDAIRTEKFPIRIHSSEFGYYGQAESVFYPELFIMIPALLRLGNMSLMNSYRIFELIINAATILIAYISFKNIFKSRKIGVVGTTLYTFSIYRLTALYVRSAVGEFCAMIFFPLLVWGIYEMFFGDEKKWWLSTVAMTGILQSHLISTELSAIVCTCFGIIHLPMLLKNKIRFIPIVKAIAFFILLNLWWLIPFLDFSNTGIGISDLRIGIQEPIVKEIWKLFAVYYPLDAGNQMPFSVGLLLFIGGCSYLILQFKNSFRNKPFNRQGLFLLGFVAILLWGSTAYFPWNNSFSILKIIGSTLQFSWRMLSIATVLLTLICLMQINYFKNNKKFDFVIIALFISSVLLASPIICRYQKVIPIVATKTYQANVDDDRYTLGGWYFPKNTEIYYLFYEPGTIKSKQELEITDFKRQGSYLHFEFKSDANNNIVELPVLFYPGYEVEVNEKHVPIRMSKNNLIEFDLNSYEGKVTLDYVGKLSYTICNWISLISLILFIYSVAKENKL